MFLPVLCLLVLTGVVYGRAPEEKILEDWMKVNPTIPPWQWADPTTYKLFPACEQGNQSPIDVPADLIKQCPEVGFEFKNLNAPKSKVVLVNMYRGASLYVDMDDVNVTVTGGPAPKGEIFDIHNLYFHVGSNSSVGSLHTLKGKSYPMEIRVDTSSVALGFVLDLHLWVEVSEKDNPAYEPIVQALSKIKKGGSSTPVTISNVGSLFPQVPNWTTNYISYVGSWVGVPCRPNMTRVIFTSTIQLSEKQIQAFREIQDEKEQPIVNNVRRPMPPLNNRPVALCQTA